MTTYYVLKNRHELASIDFISIYSKLILQNGGQPNNYLKVESISDLACLHRKYPFFNSEVSIFSIDGGEKETSQWPIHIDAGRRSALNIPILNCDMQSTTYFYSDPQPFRNKMEAVPEYQIAIIHGKLDIIDEFSLTKPTLINTSIPHAVRNYGKGKRTILSWGSMLTLGELKNELRSD